MSFFFFVKELSNTSPQQSEGQGKKGSEKGRGEEEEEETAENERKKTRSAQGGWSGAEFGWQAARGLEAECVTALWQLFVSGRFRANWCKRHSQGLLHESTRSRGVGSTPQTLLGLHSNLFYVGMQTPSTLSKPSMMVVVHLSVCVWLTKLNAFSPRRLIFVGRGFVGWFERMNK